MVAYFQEKLDPDSCGNAYLGCHVCLSGCNLAGCQFLARRLCSAGHSIDGHAHQFSNLILFSEGSSEPYEAMS